MEDINHKEYEDLLKFHADKLWNTFIKGVFTSMSTKSDHERAKSAEAYNAYNDQMVEVFYRIYRLKVISKIRNG